MIQNHDIIMFRAATRTSAAAEWSVRTLLLLLPLPPALGGAPL